MLQEELMSEANKETLRKANAAVSSGDYDGFLSHCTENTQWTFVGERTLLGKDAVRKYMAETYVEPPHFNVERMIAEDDFVTATGRIALTDHQGKVTRYAYCDVWRFDGGKMAELSAYVVATPTDR
jgi:uncharacterized protein